ncbi:hypothetical protein GGF32_008429 [Allomyces javanicus]|nr:hypothetical protein GGF32_008429 [Allomyces javanicus]
MTARHHRHHHHHHAGRPAANPAAPLTIVTSPAQQLGAPSAAATTSPTRRRCDALKLPSVAVHSTTRVLDRAAVHMHEDDDVVLDDDDAPLESRFSKLDVTDCDEDEAVVDDTDAHHPLLSSSHDSAIDFDLYTTQLAEARQKPATTTPPTKSVTFDLAHNTVRILPRDSGKAWKKLDKQLASAGITSAVTRAFARYHLYEFHGEPVLALDAPVTPNVREIVLQRTPTRSALKPVVNDLCVDHVRVARMCHVEDLEPEKAILLAWRDDWEIGMPVPGMEMPVRKSRRRRLLEEAAAKAAAALAEAEL